jgi:hypothetical protein
MIIKAKPKIKKGLSLADENQGSRKTSAGWYTFYL